MTCYDCVGFPCGASTRRKKPRLQGRIDRYVSLFVEWYKLIILHVGPQEVAFSERHIRDCPQIVVFLGREVVRGWHVWRTDGTKKRSRDEIVLVLFFLVVVGDILG